MFTKCVLKIDSYGRNKAFGFVLCFTIILVTFRLLDCRVKRFIKKVYKTNQMNVLQGSLWEKYLEES